MTVPVGSVDDARAALERGGLVAFPTETLYGLGARADDAAAVARLFKAKGLPAGRGVSLLFPSYEVARTRVVATPLADRLARALLPGPVTLVLHARPAAPRAVCAPDGTLGVRVSPHPVARALCADVPITATSANPHGVPAPETAADAARALGAAVDVIVDGGPCPGPGSTVVDARGDAPRILRTGIVPTRRIVAVAR